MLDDSDLKDSGAGLGTKLALTRLALAWERLWPIIWTPVAVTVIFLSLALLAFASMFSLLVWRAIRQIAWPSNLSARRRIETASGLDHRPLTAIDDTLVSGKDTPDSEELWQQHQQRMEVAAQSLKVSIPEPGLARKDPFAFRAALTLLLIIAGAAGWSDPTDRFTRAVTPTIEDISKPTQLALDIWITPPEYTGQPPLFPPRTPATGNMDSTAAPTPSPGILKVPAGSVLIAQIQGAPNAEAMLITAVKETPFEKVGSAYSKIIYKIGADGEHVITTGDDVLARLNIKVIPDNPPEIAFSHNPAATLQATLRLSYKAKDDYRVKQAHIEIRRVYERGTLTGLAVDKIDLPLPALSAKQINETTLLT